MEDTILNMAIDFAYQLKEDERCLALQKAQAAADADEELQQLIGEFNVKRMNINQEEAKAEDEQDADRLRRLNEEMRAVYARIMERETMQSYNTARNELDALVNKIQAAISLAVQGQDPALAAQESGCTGDCSSCGGGCGH